MLILSSDLLIYLTNYLSLKEIVCLTLTCRRLHRLYGERFFHNKLKQEFPLCLSRCSDNYRALYKYRALIPTFTTHVGGSSLLYRFESEKIVRGLLAGRSVSFLYPVPHSSYTVSDSSSYYHLIPDLMLVPYCEAIVVGVARRYTRQGFVPELGYLPRVFWHDYPSKNVRTIIEELQVTLGSCTTIVTEKSYVTSLVAQIEERGYLRLRDPKPTINSNDVQRHPDLFSLDSIINRHLLRGMY